MQAAAKIPLVYACSGSWLPVWLLVGFSISGWSATNYVTNVADNGPGSFRQAILMANTNPGPDTIVFQIIGTPPFTITPTNALPAITDPVVIDATTQPGFAGTPLIQLSGAAASGSTIGLRFSSGASTLRGMAINLFPAQAIDLTSASNVIQGNFIGTDVTGTVPIGNGSANTSPGIYVKSSGNLIGGTNTGDGNLVAGGNYVGIYLQNANNNIVEGNLIGVTVTGTTALANLGNGIQLYGSCSSNRIGGPLAQARNIISGNSASGIYLNGAAANVIQGNRIGTDVSGRFAIANAAGDGITLNGAAANTICSNLISANSFAGVSISGPGATGNRLLGNFIGTDVTGKTSLGNHLSGVEIVGTGGNQIGGTNAGDRNVISGNILDGVTLTGGTTNNLILGNLIGLTAPGTNALHNSQNGISISGGSNNVVGGVTGGARNVISGNSAYGVGILQLADTGNLVQGNFIGTDVTGTNAVANVQSGVQIQGCGNTIGGTAPGAGNVISGNSQKGIYLSGSNGNVTGNLVQGNWIGLDATGTRGLGNYIAGIGLNGAANNVIGGTTAAARNVISANGNGATGLGGVFFGFSGTTGNQLLGNYIGTDLSGTQAVGNQNDGVYLEQAATNFIGGSAPGAGNVISANGVDGIFLTNATWNVILGNFIGTKADGTIALGNMYHNIELQAYATNNFIGGTLAGAGNHIAFARTAQYSGVRVRPNSYNNLISGNSIFNNNELGIDLGTFGVTANMDCESGVAANAANAGQNYPTLASIYSGTGTRIRGTMDAKIGNAYKLQFFASPAGNASGYGEGQVFLGQTNLTLGATCSTNFTFYLPATVPPGWVVTATATDANNNTSEFSAWVPAVAMPPIQLTQPNASQISLFWTNNGGSFALLQADSLTPPIIWSVVTNVPALLNNFLVTSLGTTNASVFYRLTAQ